MLKIYICAQCGTIRIVSNNHNSYCVLCNTSMKLTSISYEDYIRLDLEQRDAFIKNYLDKRS